MGYCLLIYTGQVVHSLQYMEGTYVYSSSSTFQLHEYLSMIDSVDLSLAKICSGKYALIQSIARFMDALCLSDGIQTRFPVKDRCSNRTSQSRQIGMLL